MDRTFLQSNDFEIRELKTFSPESKEYKRKFTKLQLQMLSHIKNDFKQCTKGDEVYQYKSKRQFNMIFCIIFMVVAFALLAISIALLGNKEPKDFTSAEMWQFILWMSSVFISLCIGMFFAVRSGSFIRQYLKILIDNYEIS